MEFGEGFHVACEHLVVITLYYDMPQAWAVWKYLVSRTLSEHNSNDSQKSCLCRQTFAAERRIRQWEFRHLGVRSLGRLLLFGFQSRVWLFIIIFTFCSFFPRVVRGGGSGGGTETRPKGFSCLNRTLTRGCIVSNTNFYMFSSHY